MGTLLLDSNIFIVYLSGLINPNRIGQYSRNSLYDKSDFEFIESYVNKYDKLIICPNIMTEIDNILNRLRGNDKYNYIGFLKRIINNSTEQYIKSLNAISALTFSEIGLTDSIILDMAKNADFMISADSQLCDYAIAEGISVLDYQLYKNDLLNV